jgi:predicted neuraminidase
MTSKSNLVMPVALLLISAVLGTFHTLRTPDLIWEFAAPAVLDIATQAPQVTTVFDYKSPTGTAHSPAIHMHDDGFSIIWFDGTRESHADVVIKQVRFSKSGTDWEPSEPELYFSKEALSEVTEPRQTILSLGNAIQYGDEPDSALATIVSVGGWAAASIALIDFENGVPAYVRKLSLSPFWNRSQLVRAPTVSYDDGSVAIPAYLELGNALGELVRLDHNGYVRDKRRMSQGRFAIQPMIVPFDKQNAVALMRNFDDDSDRLIATWTADGGQSWTPATLLDAPNPNAPVAAVLLSDGRLLMAFNPSATDTTILSLAISDDQGRTWETVRTMDQDGGALRYPAMSRLPDGDILLTYSAGSKKSIKGLIFNEPWVLGK